ncbi:MAG: hypothetical protein KBT21_05900 [Treponema sp.]|nr:hypothetical protein [Candidatus Treponema merdequi]
MNLKFSKKLTAFLVAASYCLMLVPAREFREEFESKGLFVERNEIEKEKLSEEEKVSLERMLKGDVVCDDIFWGEYDSEYSEIKDATYDSLFLIHKSRLYGLLLKAKEDFFNEKKESYQSEKEIESKWEKTAEKIAEDYILESNLSDSKECDEISCDFIEMEKEVFNELLCELMQYENSIEKKSVKTRADLVADQMISEIETETAQSYADLFDKVEKADEYDEENLVVQRDEWFESFKKYIENGIYKWQKIESDFLEAKYSYESEAGDKYAESVKEWADAYDRLEQKKEAWKDEMETKLEEGLVTWQKKSLLLDEDINKAMEDYKNELLAESKQKSEAFKINCEIYTQTRSLLSTACNEIENWAAVWSEKYDGIYSYWKTEDNMQEAVNPLKNFVTIDETNCNQLKESISSVKEQYKKTTEDIILRNDESLKNIYFELFNEENILFNELEIAENWVDLICEYSVSLNESLENLRKMVFDYSDLTFVKSNFNSQKAVLESDCNMAQKQLEIYKRIYDFTVSDDFKNVNTEDLKIKLSEACNLTDKFSEEYSLLLLQIENAKEEYEKAVKDYANEKTVINNLLQELKSVETDYETAKYNDSYTNLTNLKNECISVINSMNSIFINPLITKACVKEYVNLVENHYYEKVYEDSKVIVQSLYDGFNCEYYDETGFHSYYVRGINELYEELYKIKEINKTAVYYSSGMVDESRLIDTTEIENLIDISTELAKFIKYGTLTKDYSEQEYEDMVNANGLKSAMFSQKKDSEVKSLLYDCIVRFKNDNPQYYLTMSDNEIDDFFNELNLIIKNNFCTDLVKDELSIYQNEIYKARNQAKNLDEINRLSLDLSNVFEYEININQLNYDIESFEFLFINGVLEFELPEKIKKQEIEDKNNPSNKKNYTAYTEESEMEYSMNERDAVKKLFLFDTMYEKLKVTLENTGKQLVKVNDEYQDFYIRYTDTKNKMDYFENRYADELEKLNGNNFESYFIKVKKNLEKYNDLVNQAFTKYEQLEEARDNEYVLIEAFNLKQNEYIFLDSDLENCFSPLKNYQNALSDYEEKLNRLKEFELKNSGIDYQKHLVLYDSDGNDVFDEFHDISEIYRSSEVFGYEIRNVINRQFEKYEKVLKNEAELFSSIVCETETENFELKDIVKAFVKVEKVNDVYDISFRDDIDFTKTVLDKPYEYEEACSEYLTQKCVTQYLDTGEPVFYSMSEIECGNFLKELSGKQYSIDDLMLAECYLKALFTEKSLFEEGENPQNNQNYALDSIIDKMLDVSIYTEYKNGRINTIRDSYYKVIANNGQNDLAKFIVFNEYNINENLNLLEREKAVIAKNALMQVISHLESKEKEYKTKESVAITSASAMACVAVFPVLAFFAAPSAALYVTAASYHRSAEDFAECADDIRNIINGYDIIIADEENSAGNIIASWIEKQNVLNIIQNDTYTMLYGQNQFSDKNITFDKFNKQIKKMLSDNGMDYDLYTESLYSDLEDIRTFEDLFNNAVLNHDCTTTLDAVNCITDYLARKYDSEFMKVTECADSARKNDDWNESMYLREIGNISFDTLINESKVDLKREQEDYISTGFNILVSSYENLLTEYYKNLIIEKENNLNLKKEKLNLQYLDWLNEIETTKLKGDKEWAEAEEQFKAKFVTWKNQFIDNFEKKEHDWNSEYENLLKEKAEWIDYNYTRQALSSDIDITSDYELNSRIAEISEKAKEISSAGENEYLYVIQNLNLEDICDLSGFDLISSSIENLNTEILRNAVDIFNVSKLNYFDFESSEKINKTIEKIGNDIESITFIQSSQLALESINNQINQILDMINESNRNFEKWEKQLVLKDGYTYGNEIYRDAVVDSTVFESTIRKRQTVHKYEFFETVIPEISFSVKSAKNSDIINFMLNKTYDDIRIWNEEIFGSENGDGKEGLFAEHIGFAPEFVENVNTKIDCVKNISKPGSGQLGFVMLDYIWNSAESHSGYEQLGIPLYEKKLTSENQILGIELPTLRDVTAMVCDIIGNCTGQVWVSAIDDLLFGIMDLDFNQKSADQVTVSLLKAGAASCIGSAASAAMNTVAGTAMNQVLKTTANAGIRTAQTFLSSAANSYIDAMSFTDGFSIDWNKANNFLSDGDVLRNSISAGLSYFTNQTVSSALNSITLTDGVNKALNQDIFKVSQMNSLNSVISGVAASGVERMITGKTTLNLLSAADLGFRTGFIDKNGNYIKTDQGVDVGLLAVTFDDSGVSAKIANEGTVLGLKKITDGLTGIDDALRVIKAKEKAKNGDNKEISILNGVNGLGYLGGINFDIAQNVWNDSLYVEFVNSDAEGFYNQKLSPNTIYVNEKYIGNDIDSISKFGTVLAHEGSHYLGNDVEGFAYLLSDSAYNNLINFYGCEKDLDFQEIITYGLINPESWKISNEEYQWWKVNHDGNLIFDGKTDLYDENNLLLKKTDKGFTDSLAEYLNISYQDATKLLLSYFNYDKRRSKWVYKESGAIVDLDPGCVFETSNEFKYAYDFQINYIDKVNSEYGGSLMNAVNAYENKLLSDVQYSKNRQLAIEELQNIESYKNFANEYDSFIDKYLNKQLPKEDKQKYLDAVVNECMNNNYSNESIFYTLIEKDLNPLLGETYINTKYIYDKDNKYLIEAGLANKKHSIKADTFAYDLGTHQKGLDILSIVPSNLVTSDYIRVTYGAGYELSTYTKDFLIKAKHMQENSQVLNDIRKLATSAEEINLQRFPIPQNTKIGEVGTKGFVGNYWSGPHLHGEYTYLGIKK